MVKGKSLWPYKSGAVHRSEDEIKWLTTGRTVGRANKLHDRPSDNKGPFIMYCKTIYRIIDEINLDKLAQAVGWWALTGFQK